MKPAQASENLPLSLSLTISYSNKVYAPSDLEFQTDIV